jgi:hypothetical protein
MPLQVISWRLSIQGLPLRGVRKDPFGCGGGSGGHNGILNEAAGFQTRSLYEIFAVKKGSTQKTEHPPSMDGTDGWMGRERPSARRQSVFFSPAYGDADYSGPRTAKRRKAAGKLFCAGARVTSLL